MFKVKEDEEREIEEEEEPQKKPLEFYWDMNNWVHSTPSILKQGRVVREEAEFVDEFDDEEKQEKVKAYLSNQDPYTKRLVSIVEDKCKLIR